MPDRIEIVSHPGADRSISIEGLKNYKVFNRRYRNRRIGEFLKELHLTEGRNTGFRKILTALEQNGSPKPIFEIDENRLSFTSTILIHPYFLEAGKDIVGTQKATTPQANPQATPQAKILEYCMEPQTRTEIAALLGLTDKRYVTQKYIKPLIEQGLLRMTNSDNPSSPNQKYVTVKK